MAVPLVGPAGENRFTLRGSAIRSGASGGAANPEVTLASLLVQGAWPATPPDPVLALHVEAQQIGLPPDRRWPLGPRIARLEGDLQIRKALRPLPGTGLAARVAAWRDRGGSVEVARLGLSWGALELSGRAVLGLDRRLQPQGTGSARISDPDAVLDGLRANGVLTAQAAAVGKVLLSLLARPAAPEDGKPAHPTVELPVTLEDQLMSIAGYGAVRLPALVLP